MEFYDELAEIALGWLGWSEEETLFSDVNAILVAHKGHIDRLNLINGGKPSEDKVKLQAVYDNDPRKVTVGGGQLPRLTPQAFDAMFGPKERSNQGKGKLEHDFNPRPPVIPRRPSTATPPRINPTRRGR